MKLLNPLVHVIDEPAPAAAIRSLLQEAGIPAVAHASATEFLNSYQPDLPGCLVTHARSPGMDGLELQLLLRERDIPLPMIFLSDTPQLELAVLAMKRGAADFFVKPFNDRALIESVRGALEQNAAERSRREVKRAAAARLGCLTAREREVLALLMAGRSNKIIAAELGLSPKTVEFHRSRIMMKTQAESLAELVQVVVASEFPLVYRPQTQQPQPAAQTFVTVAC